jgi:hypothetical protein
MSKKEVLRMAFQHKKNEQDGENYIMKKFVNYNPHVIFVQ